MARRLLTLAFVICFPFLSGCCCQFGWRLGWRQGCSPCGTDCGIPVSNCGSCSSCYGTSGVPAAPPVAPPVGVPVQPIPQLTAAPANAVTVPTRTLR